MTVGVCCESVLCTPQQFVSDCRPVGPTHFPPAQAGPLVNAYAIAQDVMFVYTGSNGNPAQIARIIKSTMVIDQTLNLAATEANAIDLAVDGAFLYVICRNTATGNGRVIRFNKADFTGKLVLNLTGQFGSGLAVDGGILYACSTDPGGVGSQITRIDIATFAVIDVTVTYSPGLTQSPYTLINYAGVGFPSRLVQDATYLYFGSACQFGGQSPGSITRVKKSDMSFSVLIIDNVTPAKASFGFTACDPSAGKLYATYNSAAPVGMIALSTADFFTYTYLASIGGPNSLNAFAVSRELTATSVLTGVTFIPFAPAQEAAILKDLSAVTLAPFAFGVEREARGVCYDAATDNRYDIATTNIFGTTFVYRS